MREIRIIAVKEIREGLRNRWVVAATLVLGILALTLAFVGGTPTGSRIGAGALDIVVVSLSSLTIFLVPLIALLISHDAVVGEIERGTMLLLLSYPVSRGQVVFGKFLGHLAILAFATCVGYGAAAGALAAVGADISRSSLGAFAAMIGSSILLGAVFVSLGYLVSALADGRGTAAGLAVGLWLLFVLVYDMALLGALAFTGGRVFSAAGLNALLLLNPTDAYRLFNMTAFADVSRFSGMAGLAADVTMGPGVLLGALLVWVAVPLGLAVLVFSRREI
ncbi:MAG: ABC transporter permease [Methylobacteriaceae bacterium]|jgi:Cu-processing system permease protein|nr:ABC transporter permease [Methylobacteriaceae bacterium]